ncbi:MAG: hypothetical protein K0R85_395 [Devosia sp.]|jgi:hypothetical protein|nr:hypothetical protein [Devosia sp.]
MPEVDPYAEIDFRPVAFGMAYPTYAGNRRPPPMRAATWPSDRKERG